MEPEVSTAIIRCRPVVGTAIGSPSHCGRVAAAIKDNHINTKTNERQREAGRKAGVHCAEICAAKGTKRAPLCGFAGVMNRLANHGRGKKTSIQGQAICIIFSP
jgi:hypothetical protein